MPTCTNTSCGQDFDPLNNGPKDCAYHPGAPVFHEGSKAWSCCKDVNKPVLDFEDFMNIKGCTRGQHSAEKKAPVQPAPSPNVPAAPATTSQASSTKPAVETYGTPSQPPAPTVATKTPSAKVDWSKNEVVDDANAPVAGKSKCKRRGCGHEWPGQDGAPRGSLGPVDETEGCVYHPGIPSFLEGSKGYLCCKPRVLDFDDFLKIPGCRTTSHQYIAPPANGGAGGVEMVDCRLDHYQTPDKVMVSCFAKNVNKETSKVKLTVESIELDLDLPGNKRCTKTVQLYEAIDPDASDFKILGTKVEFSLKKAAVTSWPLLEKPTNGASLPPGYALTFGAGGRTGSVGAK